MKKVINQIVTDRYSLYNGDCCEVLQGIPENSIHYSIFSPPFSSLYTYSNSERDLGNCKTDEEFMTHFRYVVKQLFKCIIPGRLVSVHCMNLPVSKQNYGYIGIRDFRGDIIRLFTSHGFIYASEVCIWKNPVTAMQRTKALGLLHKQLVKDACMSRQGIPDYVVTFRKPGENTEPVAGELDHFCGDKKTFRHTGKLSIDIWQRYASPVWMDINPSNTLQYRAAKDSNDERHICPLQLDVIERCIQLWTNENDIVLSPFAGIASEGYQAVKMGRRSVLIELKASYFKQAVKNMRAAARDFKKKTLF